jgi:hypothetical protein
VSIADSVRPRAAARARPGRGQLLTPNRRRAIFHGAVLGGLIFFAYIFLVAAPVAESLGYDAYAYWTVDLNNLYRGSVGDLGFFPYSPPIAVAFLPLTALSWTVFLALWYAIQGLALLWLGRASVLVLLAFPPVAIELYHGNIHLLLAAAVVAGFRYPPAWAFVLLTKTTSGVGLLWFAARREWRNLFVAGAFTAVVVVVSVVALPDLWSTWVNVLSDSAGESIGWPAIPVPLWLRLPAAAAIVWWGARRNARWTVPLAATLALPVLWIAGLSVLVGCWPLLRNRTAETSRSLNSNAHGASPAAV